MLLLLPGLCAADAAESAATLPASAPAAARGAVREAPAPAWQFFAAPAGLSLTTSLLLTAPAVVGLFFVTTLSVVTLAAAPPIVAVVGVDRLIGADRGASVGIVVGDVVGVVVGAVAGVVAYDRFFSARFDDSVYAKGVALGGSVLAGVGVGRALFCGVGGGVGHLFSPPETED